VDSADFGKLMGVLVACSTVLLTLFAWWVLRAPRRPGDSLDAAYRRLRTKLAKAGVASADSDGPLTLAERVHTRRPSDTSLADVFADYVRLRYALAAPAEREIKRFAQAVASLRLITVSRAK